MQKHIIGGRADKNALMSGPWIVSVDTCFETRGRVTIPAAVSAGTSSQYTGAFSVLRPQTPEKIWNVVQSRWNVVPITLSLTISKLAVGLQLVVSIQSIL